MAQSQWRQKLLNSLPFTLIAGASTLLLISAAWYALRLGQEPLSIPLPPAAQKTAEVEPLRKARTSDVIEQLALAPVGQRSSYLEKLTQQGSGIDRARARFMWANDLLNDKQAQKALPLLKDLEKDFPVLGSEVLVLRAQAYALVGQTEQSNQTWQALLKDYPKDPAVVEALFVLGRQDPQYWDQALEKFPAHPLSVAIAQERLKQTPDDLELLRLIARHGFHLTDLKTYLKQLTDKHAAVLTPEDWHAVGFGYWEKLTYKEAGEAYAKAPKSPLNYYRAARGLQLGQAREQAIAGYKKLVETFPKSEEAALAYLKLGEIADPIEQRMPYLEKGMALAKKQGRTHLIAEGLRSKAYLEKQLQLPQAQAATEQKLLTEYASSDAAATLLWERAKTQAKAKNFAAARENAWKITQNSPQNSLAAPAAFWAGLWAQKLGDTNQQKQAFQFLWDTHPDSYFTWRSGSLSGWPVGDFQTVRAIAPQPNWPNQQLPIAAGSPALQELYGMGQSLQAWKRWLVEFQSREQPSIPDQQTDGLIRIGVGEYLDGIFMLNNLDDRLAEEPEYRDYVHQWRSHPGFWYALYPLAYYPETAGWAQTVKINPFLALGLMRQESRFQPKIRSGAGAVGLMQIMPDTGQWIASQLKVKNYDLQAPKDNIRFGTWYLDEVHQTYKNNSVLAIASYNAGPGNVADWVKKNQGLSPDEFIDSIPFEETRKYVTAVLENHWNYLRLYDPKYQKLVPNNFP